MQVEFLASTCGQNEQGAPSRERPSCRRRRRGGGVDGNVRSSVGTAGCIYISTAVSGSDLDGYKHPAWVESVFCRTEVIAALRFMLVRAGRDPHSYAFSVALWKHRGGHPAFIGSEGISELVAHSEHSRTMEVTGTLRFCE